MLDIASLPEPVCVVATSEPDRHADMTARESEPLIEPLRIDAGVMGEQFDDLAASRARPFDGPAHELLADTAAAAIGGDADILDQAARGALRAQPRQNAKLQAADDAPRL